MLQNIKKRTEGFTIIEVLIVLAIAGLIMVIVFFAVPALQRNSRNTRTRDDVGKALSGASDWITNNSGKLPTTGTAAEVTANATSISTQSNLTEGVTVSLAKDVTNVAAAADDKIQIVTGVRCSGTGVKTAATLSATDMKTLVSAGSARSYVALFTIEAAGGQRTSQCQGS